MSSTGLMKRVNCMAIHRRSTSSVGAADDQTLSQRRFPARLAWLSPLSTRESAPQGELPIEDSANHDGAVRVTIVQPSASVFLKIAFRPGSDNFPGPPRFMPGGPFL